MNQVISASPLADGKVFLELNDGRSGEFDVRPFMTSDFFQELADPTYFRQVRIVFKGIGWPDGQDLGPDTLAAELVPIEACA